MHRLYFMRHGQSAHNVTWKLSAAAPGPPLTEAGRAQVRDRIPYLRACAPRAILSSPLLRARQTAEIVASALGLPVEVDDDLREMNVGSLEGRSDPASVALVQNAAEFWLDAGDLDYRPAPGAESGGEAVARVEGLVRRLAGERPHGDVLLVSHATLLQTSLSVLCENVRGDSDPERWLKNAGVIATSALGGRLRCDSWNDQFPVRPADSGPPGPAATEGVTA